MGLTPYCLVYGYLYIVRIRARAAVQDVASLSTGKVVVTDPSHQSVAASVTKKAVVTRPSHQAVAPSSTH